MTDIITYDRIVAWEEDLRELSEEIAGPLFTRPEPRATFADLVRGLLADVARKNSWQLADHVGHGTAYRIEWLLNGAKWDADALRDRVRDYVVAGLRPEAAGRRGAGCSSATTPLSSRRGIGRSGWPTSIDAVGEFGQAACASFDQG